MIEQHRCEFCTETKLCVAAVNDGKVGWVCKDCLDFLCSTYEDDQFDEE